MEVEYKYITLACDGDSVRNLVCLFCLKEIIDMYEVMESALSLMSGDSDR